MRFEKRGIMELIRDKDVIFEDSNLENLFKLRIFQYLWVVWRT